MINVYEGKTDEKGDTVVTVNDQRLDPRLDLVNKSPTGFSWGYHGSGPAQLALAMLCHEFGETVALAYFQDFKRRKIAELPQIKGWQMTSQDLQVYVAQVAEREYLEEMADRADGLL